MLDPTCLITAEHYRAILTSPNCSHKYILLYLLGKHNIDINEIIEYANEHGYIVYYIGSQGECTESIAQKYHTIKFIYPTILEWLGWIDNCELFVTNSFHGAVFSIIFNKQNIIYTGKGLSREGGSDRFYTLLSNIGLLNRINHCNTSELLKNKIDYNKVNYELGEQRNRCLTLLRNSLNS